MIPLSGNRYDLDNARAQSTRPLGGKSVPRSRFSLFVLALALLALPLHAATPCNLAISMTCTSGHCTSTTVNNGASACSGDYIAIFLSQQPSVTVSGMTTSLGLSFCFDSTTFPQQESAPFALCFGTASLNPGASFTASANVSTTGVSQPSISIVGVTEVDDSDTGDELAFVYTTNDISVPTCTPRAALGGSASSARERSTDARRGP